ncbi:MAG: polyprenyl synthetase family protein [Lachnospiraceae bacterium]|nr:polyprenyl synthetase family protein [Lachnospiraceae bacterium]
MGLMIEEQIRQRATEIEAIIDSYLPEIEGYQKTVIDAMHYTIKAGGKRLRPMLMQETFRLFGGEGKVIEPFMAAIEMIHTYSLIHDDLPALDNDDYRRGRKTAHVVYGEDMAILAGDALLNYAFETASKAFDMDYDSQKVGKAFQVLSRKPGIHGMIGGQVADVLWTGDRINMEQLLFIHRLKTSALIECSMMIGAILAGATKEQVQIVEKIGENIGIAFQIQDDVLDVISTTEELGKPVGSDEEQGKVTYVALKGLEESQKDVELYTMEAIGRLDSLPYENTFLRELLLYLIHRNK